MKKTDKIRNFCIIAHIDHGKSTLADRMLELTGTIEKREMHDQFMDTLELEQERGITIKLQTARMEWEYKSVKSENLESGKTTSVLPDSLHEEVSDPSSGKVPKEEGVYILNLIDTPGHVDFAYEVSRSLAACEGALLLVDASQGIEAQTISNAMKAIEHGLEIIPVINKIDLPNAEPERRAEELKSVLGFRYEEIVFVSGKSGINVDKLLDAVIERIPSPSGDFEAPLQALVFDSFYDDHKGVVAQIRVFEGELDMAKLRSIQAKIYFAQKKTIVEPVEIGYLKPYMSASKRIDTGEVGYIATGLKDITLVRVGDTVTTSDRHADILPGYEPAKSMVFAGFFPINNDDAADFRDALMKLSLNDASLNYIPENSIALGLGFRCGFLGLLHMEIIKERLEREYGMNLLVTAPSVEYRVELMGNSRLEGTVDENYDEKGHFIVRAPSDLPDISKIQTILEPWVKMEIITPDTFIGDVMSLASGKRAIYINTEYIEQNAAGATLKRVILKYEIPLSEIVTDFFDKMKSMTHGYASLDYTFDGFKPSDIVRVDILVNNEKVDALAFLCHRSTADRMGRNVVAKLKEVIPKHQFKVPIQAAIGAKIIAREDISAYRKNVLKGMYGGDETRKMKKLEKQKKGKERMKKFGKVTIPQEAFMAVMKS
ncbi:MAG: translation elongation factor 4 [bacterium]